MSRMWTKTKTKKTWKPPILTRKDTIVRPNMTEIKKVGLVFSDMPKQLGLPLRLGKVMAFLLLASNKLTVKRLDQLLKRRSLKRFKRWSRVIQPVITKIIWPKKSNIRPIMSWQRCLWEKIAKFLALSSNLTPRRWSFSNRSLWASLSRQLAFSLAIPPIVLKTIPRRVNRGTQTGNWYWMERIKLLWPKAPPSSTW